MVTLEPIECSNLKCPGERDEFCLLQLKTRTWGIMQRFHCKDKRMTLVKVLEYGNVSKKE